MAAGATAGVVALGGLPAAIKLLTRVTDRKPVIGAVVPSVMFAGLDAAGFEEGIRMSLGQELLERVQLKVRTAGPGPGSVLAQATALIDEDFADLVVAWSNPARTDGLGDLSERSGVPIVAAEAGANAPDAEPDPRLFYHTLGYWQANHAMGTWAAQNMGSRCAVACSLYESGFDSLLAFNHGFESAGGEIVSMTVTHLPDGDVAETVSSFVGSDADFVYALHCGDEATEFVQAYADAGLSGALPLAMSSFALEVANLDALGDNALGIKSAATWTDTPSALAALGQEVGGLLRDAFESDASAITDGAIADGPRSGGALSTGTDSPIFIREVAGSAAARANALLAEVGRTSDIDPVASALRDGPRTGWSNAYGSLA